MKTSTRKTLQPKREFLFTICFKVFNLVSRVSHPTAMRDPGNEIDNEGDGEFYTEKQLITKLVKKLTKLLRFVMYALQFGS